MPLPLPLDFDIGHSDIQIFVEWNTWRFVKTVHPKHTASEGEDWIVALTRYYVLAREAAEILWLAKYGEVMPEEVEGVWAESISASAFRHEGVVKLTDTEWQAVCNAANGSDLTLDILWLVVERLNWKPGVPVPLTDPKWENIWAEEMKCVGYIDIVHDLLNMPFNISDAERKAGWRRHGWKSGSGSAGYTIQSTGC